jgi:hypothetical protein
MGKQDDLQAAQVRTAEGAETKPEAGVVSPEVQEKIDHSNKEIHAWAEQIKTVIEEWWGAREEQLDEKNKGDLYAGGYAAAYDKLLGTLSSSVETLARAGITLENESSASRIPVGNSTETMLSLETILTLKKGYKSIELLSGKETETMRKQRNPSLDRNKDLITKLEMAKSMLDLFNQ